MAKLYGFGASVVLVGALFKIQHWPFAGMMLTIGMTTEAIIFFFSAFEPIHEEVDWTLVYPELAGMTDEEELQRYRRGPRTSEGASSGALAKFDEMLEKGDISQELFNKLGEGLKNLSQTASNMSEISNATLATNSYVENVNSASKNFESFNEEYSKSSENLNQSIHSLSNSYQQLSDSVGNNFENISKGNSSYTEKLEQLNKNLEALNAVYELQLKGSGETMKNSKELYDGMGQMMQDLKASINETKQYKEEISQLHKNLAELNNIYGNMLSSMNVTMSSQN